MEQPKMAMETTLRNKENIIFTFVFVFFDFIKPRKKFSIEPTTNFYFGAKMFNDCILRISLNLC